MATIDELLATLQEDDPEAAKALQEALTAAATEKETLAKQLAKKDRDYRLATDKTFEERYPRAMMVFKKGKLSLPDDLSDEDLGKALKEKEEELADLGVPLPSGGAKAPAPTQEAQPDPAQSWGEPVAGSPNTPEEDPVKDFWEALRGSTGKDRTDMADALWALNLMGHGKSDKENDKIKQIADEMGKDPWNAPIGERIW